jgi:hypothetical protein
MTAPPSATDDAKDARQALAAPGWTVAWATPRGNYSESLAGIDWADAESPPWDHHCTPQTRGALGLSVIERCACGAARYNHGSWIERNSKRLEDGETPPAPQPRARPHRAGRIQAATGRLAQRRHRHLRPGRKRRDREAANTGGCTPRPLTEIEADIRGRRRKICHLTVLSG